MFTCYSPVEHLFPNREWKLLYDILREVKDNFLGSSRLSRLASRAAVSSLTKLVKPNFSFNPSDLRKYLSSNALWIARCKN